MGEKSLTGSYGIVLKRLRFNTIVLAVVSSTYPSGAAFATASVPMLPLAPDGCRRRRLPSILADF
jgi:hypothetical protein